VLDRPSDLPITFTTNYRGILGSCPLIELSTVEHVFEVQADIIDRRLEQIGHLPLRQPDCFMRGVKPNLNGLARILKYNKISFGRLHVANYPQIRSRA
jgi:hypothetical protein